MELFTDTASAGIERALDGVAAQQRATAANIANAATPGYRAQRVSFADNLASAMASGQDPRSAALTTQDAGTPADLSGNTVQLNTELTNQQREGLAVPGARAGHDLQAPAVEDGARQMSMFGALDAAASGVSLGQTWMDTIGDNVANLNTVRPAGQEPYRAQLVVARSLPGTQGVGSPASHSRVAPRKWSTTPRTRWPTAAATSRARSWTWRRR